MSKIIGLFLIARLLTSCQETQVDEVENRSDNQMVKDAMELNKEIQEVTKSIEANIEKAKNHPNWADSIIKESESTSSENLKFEPKN